MACHLGDFDEYWGLLAQANELREEDRLGRDKARKDAIRARWPAATGRGHPRSIRPSEEASRSSSPHGTASRRVLGTGPPFFRLPVSDFDEPPQVLTRIALPRSGSTRSARYRRDVAASLVSLQVKPSKDASRRPAIRRSSARPLELEALAAEHPCASCPERAKHERWATRVDEKRRSLRGVERRIRVRTETLARQFDRVLAVLRTLGYVEGWRGHGQGADAGADLRRGRHPGRRGAVRGLFDDLAPAEVAALLSSVGLRGPRARAVVGGACRPRPPWSDTSGSSGCGGRSAGRRTSTRCSSAASSSRASPRPSSTGRQGKPLEDVLAETEMAPGDFVRNCKQLLDLLRQIEEVAQPDVAALFAAARTAVLRGVVAYTGV